ncbi:MAG: gliding motility-associated C-terminal domain-containing protein [Chitinophagales bacterium]|nr:gliding motility-associated C-terminal domain-containing protein [Chitinophagales bacterium]
MRFNILQHFFVAIIAILGAGHNLYAQTINPPTINCVSTDETTGDVNISFTPAPLDPCGTFNRYVIYGATNPGGPFTLVGTITNPSITTFTHTGANATILDWYYTIAMEQNCVGSTSPQSSPALGEQLLDIPELDYVTVTSSGVQVVWYPVDPNSAVDSLVIAYTDTTTGLQQPLDTLPSTATSYLDITNNANGSSVTYTIKALDACGQPSIYSPLEHNTLFLDAVVNNCLQQVTLQFNRYRNWPNDTVSGYLLEVSIDNGTPIDSSLGSPFQSGLPSSARTSTIFNVAGLEGDSIVFRVVAVHPDGVKRSYSNRIALPLDILKSTAFNYMSFGSVTDTSVIDIAWIIDTVADIKDFIIKRSQDGLTFTPIDTISADSNTLFERFYADSGIVASSGDYYYQVDSRDTCGFILSSTTVRTIFLQGSANETNNELTWSPFEMGRTYVLSYTIYQVKDDSVLVPLETALPSVNNYTHQIADAVTNDGKFCYIVQAKCVLNLPDQDIVSREFYSLSNVVCLDKDPVIWIPNAFVPAGINNTFRPVMLFGVDEYDFRIFDRWGKQLFITTNFAEGWDGTYRGEKMPLGGYVYQLRVTSATGEKFERRGVVALVR